MTLYDYLKLAIRHSFMIIIITLFCVVGGYVFSRSFNPLPYQSTLFISIGVEDKNNKLSSSYENIQAAEQVTESIQGWLKDPSLINQIYQESKLNWPITAKKQEKNNLLITFPATEPQTAQLFSNQIINQLSQRLTQYNANSDLKINLATTNLNISAQSSKTIFIILISLIIGFITSFIAAVFWEMSQQVIKSTSELENFTKKKPLATYSSDRALKKNYFFLSKYLQEKVGKNSLQILNLTHQDKFNFEPIAKQAGLGKVKNLNLPADFDQISLTLPTLLIVEIGYSKNQIIQQLNEFKLEQLEIISLEKVYK